MPLMTELSQSYSRGSRSMQPSGVASSPQGLKIWRSYVVPSFDLPSPITLLSVPRVRTFWVTGGGKW